MRHSRSSRPQSPFTSNAHQGQARPRLRRKSELGSPGRRRSLLGQSRAQWDYACVAVCRMRAAVGASTLGALVQPSMRDLVDRRLSHPRGMAQAERQVCRCQSHLAHGRSGRPSYAGWLGRHVDLHAASKLRAAGFLRVARRLARRSARPPSRTPIVRPWRSDDRRPWLA